MKFDKRTHAYVQEISRSFTLNNVSAVLELFQEMVINEQRNTRSIERNLRLQDLWALIDSAIKQYAKDTGGAE